MRPQAIKGHMVRMLRSTKAIIQATADLIFKGLDASNWILVGSNRFASEHVGAAHSVSSGCVFFRCGAETVEVGCYADVLEPQVA